MSPKDVAGVFSRPFVIGHFLPAFFMLAVGALLSHTEALPSGLQNASSYAVQLILIGAAALPLGLLLSSVHAHVVRTFSGEATERQALEKQLSAVEEPSLWAQEWPRWWLRGLVRLPLTLPKSALARMHARGVAVQSKKMKRWQLRAPQVAGGRAHVDTEFPDTIGRLLPTRLGNGIRAYQSYAHSRYGLEGTVVWPRIEMLLGPEQRSLIADAKTEVAFFLNCALATIVVAAWVAVDIVRYDATAWWLAVDAVVAVVVFTACRLSAVTATYRVGPLVRAAVDVCRLELYDRLGVLRPVSTTEEQRVAMAINCLLTCGVAIQDDLRARREQE